MKIGILITGHPPEELAGNGRYDAYFKRLLGDDTFTYQTWSVVDGEMPQGVHDADGWLITGSRHGAYEPHPWIPPLEGFIRDCFAAKVPMIGVCFGHQIIAQAMGGKVEKYDKGWSVGHVEYDIEGQKMTINAWHQDQVTAKPDAAKTIGSSDFCAHAALLYDDIFWTIQPHPEYGHDFIEGLLRYRGKGIVPDDQIAKARARLELPLDSRKIADQMIAFFKKERA
ncbi:Glutamine amidotransferase class I-like protein [Sulfitobacter noctilucicola]|uniref:GMP synthase (Glutamine-hydrolyzing) n=1 Tax=Sulfitobacter noctilucicola TaxID=1342301 RepID=A0A7W6MAE4_9RHOB|nr:type 1 glutamine amidotransferase [Sulfitobacter noctilucicola]KIN64430.1 Glutamine amidotransferase class I-like protein [Sulfitobacter noctilucicola]MBB4174411.1 GMP synthase (glutamine-hydrolyzing) [Sulfitobacter noctilucicola]